jgi:predicted secreted Zn-dependent protease
MTLTDSTVGYAAAAVKPHTAAHTKTPEIQGKTREELRRNVGKMGPSGYSPRALAAVARTRGTRKGLVR